jgi:hypothetical protein
MFNRVVNSFKLLKPNLPLKINIEMRNNKNFVDTDDLMYFKSSYLSLVTETFYFPKSQWGTIDETTIFFSEKIFKPIAVKHPFMIVSRPYSLKWFRTLGYKTFHPYINEAYDTVESDSERLACILTEMERLCSQTDSQWLEWQHGVKSIVEHNFNVLYSKEKFKYARRP